MKEIEILEKRRAREKHFLQENGEIIAKIYDNNIHYLKDGKYEEIDNTLMETEDGYCNLNNNYKVSFKKNINKSIMKMENEQYFLEIKLKDIKNIKLKKKKCINKLIDEIRYDDILDNIDLEYKVLPTKVKENIIIKEKNCLYDKIEFVIETNLTLLLNMDKSITAVKDGKPYFLIESPFMIDANGKINKNIYYEIAKNGNSYKLNLILDTKWLNSVDTVYPVIIDPTITNYGQENNVYDTYIYSGDTSIDRNNQDKLKVGVERVNGVDIINRSLLKFELPTIGTGSQILSAVVNLIGYPLSTPSYQDWLLEVHEITSDWNETTANWSNMNNKYNNRVETLFYGRRSSVDSENVLNPQIMQINITSLVRRWYTDKTNNGIMLKLANEEYTNDIIPIFFSKNNTVEGYNPKPVLMIRYYNQNGLENYMDYQKQNFKQGNVYINNYNGNLTSIFNIMKTIKTTLPAKVNLAYNTNDVVLNKDLGYGLGFKFDLHQTIKETPIDGTLYLEYNDGDGTIHYFYKNGDTFYDENGLNYLINKTDDFYMLEDKNGIKKKFNIRNQIGYLSEISDMEQNIITILYNSNELINKIIDSDNNEITIVYNENSIAVNYLNETVTLNYNNQKLQSIQKQTGITAFTYNEKNIISKITDENGLSIGYEYYDVLPYRVKKITEYGLNNTIGKFTNISYGYDSTTLMDNKNITNTIVFNSVGNIASRTSLKSRNNIKDAIGIRKSYGQSNNSFNKLTSMGIPVSYIKNYLSNISFENDNVTFVSGDNTELLISNDCSVSGVKSLKVINNAANEVVYQDVNVPKGCKYTLSAYIKNTNKIRISLSYINASNENVEVTSDEISANDQFYRYDVTIDYPSDAMSLLKIKLLLEESGITYVDDIQLEEGEAANYFNLIENSDFTNGLSGWDVNIENSDDRCEIITVEGNPVLKINMDPNNAFTIGKIINVSGKRGDLYNISFWYKCNGIDESDDFTFNNITVNFDEVSGYGHCALQSGNFNTNPDEWQFFSYNFVAVDDYIGLDFKFLQNLNANDLYIANICLIKDFREGQYSYDANGNIINLMDFDNEITSFGYDANNQLISMTTPRGSKFTYEYDNLVKDRLNKSLTSSGISNQMTYNQDGNPILSKIKNVREQNTEMNGIYKIRMKGTDKYIKYVENVLKIEENDCCNCNWIIEKEDNYYKIKHPILEERYLNVLSQEVSIGSYQWDNSLYDFISQEDGSYLIKCKLTNVYLVNYNGFLNCDGSPSEQVEDRYKFYIEESVTSDFIEVNAEYTEDGKYIKETTDSLFGVNTYEYYSDTGLIKRTTNAKGIITNYEYNDKKQMTSISQDNKTINMFYNEQGAISNIKVGQKDYKFIYDDFLKIKSINIGSGVNLINNEYESNNGNLLKATYGNLDSISYTYDELDRVVSINKMNDSYQFKYDKNGNLIKIKSNNDEIKFIYDLAQRVHEYNFNGLKVKYTYDKNNNISSKSYLLNDIENSIINEYNESNLPILSSFENVNVTYNYDSLERIIDKKINNVINSKYRYVSNGHRTSTLVNELENMEGIYSYRYDSLENITHIYLNNKLINKYYYDNYNQLIEDNNYLNNTTTRYRYDGDGNILYKRIYELNTYNLLEQKKFEYNDLYWKDKLTKVDDKVITYDEIGNPLTIGNDVALSWINGKELNTYTSSGNLIEFKYNKDGIRTSKKVNNIETKYYLEDNKIIYEKTNDDILYYMRTCDNDLIGFRYNNESFFYLKNLQNDIIGITDNNNNIIAKYQYDAYGNILAITDSFGNKISENGQHIASKNPFRYRSYYYDKETGLYYINSRYYNPSWGRFINADRYMPLNSNYICYNLFAYAINNPINYYDLNGNIFKKAWNWCKNTYKKVKEKVVEVYNTIKNAFTAEVGVGFGLGKSSNVTSVSAYKDMNWGIDDGKTYTSTTTSIGATVNLSQNSKHEVGIGYSIDHKDHEWRAGDDLAHINPMSMPWDIADCEDTTHNVTLGLGTKTIKNNVEVTDPEEKFIGIDFELHFVIGGHIKIGFNIG